MTFSSYSNFILEQLITQHKFSSSFSYHLRRLAGNDSFLTRLPLSGNEIGDTGAAAMAQALSFNTILTTLNIELNKISDTGAAAIAQALKSNSSLTALQLHDNEIGNTGAVAIAQALSINSSLTTLNLKCNKIEDTGATAIAQALTFNTALTALYLHNNCVSKVLELSICKQIETNKHNKRMRAKTLQKLCCSALSSADKNIMKINFPSYYTLYFSAF